MGVLIMHVFGKSPEAELTWWHNCAVSSDFVGATTPAVDDYEAGFFDRFLLLSEVCRSRPAGTPVAYGDNDFVHFRRDVPLEPDLGPHCVGLVPTSLRNIPYNAGMIYARAGYLAAEFFTYCYSLKAKMLADRSVQDGVSRGDPSERALARAARHFGVAELEPAWNDWMRATGERSRPCVVKAFHGVRGEAKLAQIRDAIALSKSLEVAHG